MNIPPVQTTSAGTNSLQLAAVPSVLLNAKFTNTSGVPVVVVIWDSATAPAGPNAAVKMISPEIPPGGTFTALPLGAPQAFAAAVGLWVQAFAVDSFGNANYAQLAGSTAVSVNAWTCPLS